MVGDLFTSTRVTLIFLAQTFAGFILTVYKCISAIGWDRPIRMPITTLFLRDGVMWFLAAFCSHTLPVSVRHILIIIRPIAVMVVSMVIWSSARPSLSQITAMYVLHLVSFLVIITTYLILCPRPAVSSVHDLSKNSSVLTEFSGHIRSSVRGSY